MGGGSCLLLGERRKFRGVQGALSRAALGAPAGAKLPLLPGWGLGGRDGPRGVPRHPPRVVPCSKNTLFLGFAVPQGFAAFF